MRTITVDECVGDRRVTDPAPIADGVRRPRSREPSDLMLPKTDATPESPFESPSPSSLAGPTIGARAARSPLRRALPYAAIVLLAFLAYANTLGHPFVYDDSHIARSPLLHEPWNLRAIWNGEFYGPRKVALALYRPLADWGYLVNYRLNELVLGDGTQPIGFHAVDILLHAAASVLLYAWLRRLRLDARVAITAALLFAVHPLHTETVAPTVNRSDSQALVFGLAFLLLHARRTPIAPAVMYLGALWSKESAAAFFPLAVAADAIVPELARDSAREIARPRWPIRDYALLAATFGVWLWMRSRALDGVPTNFTFQENPLQVAAPFERALTAAAIQVRYLGLMLVPIDLSSDYSFDVIRTASTITDARVLGFAAVLCAAVAASWKLRRSSPVIALCVAGYAITFSTTSNFLFPIGTIMAERLAYTPSMFACALLAIGAWELAHLAGARAIAVLVALVCAAFLWRTVERNRTWSDNFTFYREQVRTAPRSAKAHGNMALALVEIGDDRGAIEEYRRALAILPKYPRTWYLLGNALHRLKENPEAIIGAYRQTILLDPTHVDARVNLAVTLLDLGRAEEARTLVAEIRALDPDHPWLAELARRSVEDGASRPAPR